MNLEKLKFPIGKYNYQEGDENNHLDNWINDISQLPFRIEELIKESSLDQLNLKYRPEGWSIKQVIHHLSDSHINSIIRFKKALTEINPTISPYQESKWAELIDGVDDDCSHSMAIISSVHHKWTKLLKSLSANDFIRTFYHPENKRTYNLYEITGMYAWHSNHHLAHIKQALELNENFNS